MCHACEPLEPALIVVLFDIDGTLIDGYLYWKSLLFEAAKGVIVENLDVRKFEIAGKTDIGILREICENSNYDFEQVKAIIIDSYLGNFDDSTVSDHYDLLPNVKSTLNNLRARSVELGIITGNLRKAASRKLALKGIDTLFNLEISCFAENGETREELLGASLEKIRNRFQPSKIYYVGDTPNDIYCANKVGIFSVAVATSEIAPVEALKNARPHLFLSSLSESASLIDDLFNGPDHPDISSTD